MLRIHAYRAAPVQHATAVAILPLPRTPTLVERQFSVYNGSEVMIRQVECCLQALRALTHRRQSRWTRIIQHSVDGQSCVGAVHKGEWRCAG
jgi:hypothetical protein